MTTIHTRHLKIQHAKKVNNTKIRKYYIQFLVFFPRYTVLTVSTQPFTSHHFTTHINFSNKVWFFPYSLHCTALHFTSLHFTSLHFTSLHYTPPVHFMYRWSHQVAGLSSWGDCRNHYGVHIQLNCDLIQECTNLGRPHFVLWRLLAVCPHYETFFPVALLELCGCLLSCWRI